LQREPLRSLAGDGLAPQLWRERRAGLRHLESQSAWFDTDRAANPLAADISRTVRLESPSVNASKATLRSVGDRERVSNSNAIASAAA